MLHPYGKTIGIANCLLLAFISCFISCKTDNHVDLKSDLEELARLQQQERRAHLEEQPALIVNMLADTLIQVKNGKVDRFTKDQMTERFIKYFETVEFIKWEDAQPPIYSVSGDGSMANILIQKLVIVSATDQEGSSRDTTHFAWTEFWQKNQECWKLHQVTTTDDMD
jgi:hypothetical protein